MAAYDDSLLINEGQSWSLWAENIGFRSPNSDHEDEDAKSNQDKSSTCLNREEMAIYGYCPRWEDFYLVVCNLCGKAIKPQALRQHIDLRHKGEINFIKFEPEVETKPSKSRLKRHKTNPYKYEPKLENEESFHENSVSPLDSLANENELNVENVNYKSSIISRECNTVTDNSLNRNSDNLSSQGCNFLSITSEVSSLPLLKLKSDSLDDSFMTNHPSPTRSLPSRLPPPVPPEPQQHVIPPCSPHSGPPPSIGPPTPTLGPGSVIGPPTPGREPPPTPVMGPSPGIGPPTPGMGPPTPGIGPPTPGIGPPTPGIRPATPGMSPLTPVMGSSSNLVGPLTPGMLNPVSSMGQQIPSQSQVTNICPATPTYVSQSHILNLGPPAPSLGGHPQGVSPLATPTHIAQSPNLEQAVQSGATQNSRTSPIAPNLSQQISVIGNQAMRIDALSPNVSSNTPVLTSENLNQVNITYGQEKSISLLPQEEVHGSERSVSIPNPSAEEEVNRISAMLMKEAEELSCQSSNTIRSSRNTNLHGVIASHDIVEAQGLAAGGMRQELGLATQLSVGSVPPSTSTKVPITSSSNLGLINSSSVNASQTLGSVPVPMSSMSMATLKQIQADLLATVSESDLNAVLNITPDNPVLPSSHCYLSGNNQYSDRVSATNEQFAAESSHLNNQGVIHYSSNDTIPVPVMNQMTSEIIIDSERNQNSYSNSSTVIQEQFSNSHEQISGSDNTLQINDNDKNNHCDELSRAVDSITKLCQENSNTSIESHLGLVNLLHQPTLASPSNLQSNNSSSSINLNSLSTPSTQGITVVIGGNQDNSSTPISLSLTSLAGSLKKTPVASTLNSSLLNHLTSSNSNNSSVQSVNVELPLHDTVQNNQDQYCQNQQQTLITQPHKLQTTTIQQQSPVLARNQSTQAHFNSQIATQSQQQTHYLSNHSLSQQQQQQQSANHNHSQVNQQQYQTTTVSVPPPTPSPKKSSKKKKPGERKLLPLKDREYDAEIHCGVLIMDTGKPCTRSLTCKTHSLSLRRAVHGRSKKFDELLCEHKAAKEAQMKASKPSEAAASLVQNTPPRGSVGMNSNISSSNSSSSGQLNGPSTSSTSSSSLLIRTLGSTTATSHGIVPHSDPSPTISHIYSMDPPNTTTTFQTTPPSPAYWPSQRIAPPLSHSDNFFVREPPKPIAVCSYNARRLGGFLATDHKVDSLRSSFANALKKPQSGSFSSDTSITNNIILNNNIERYNNVKPLLARKLQATIPSNSTNSSGNKEGIGVGVGYNGHIQLNSNSGVAIHNSSLAASLKRPTHPEILRHNSTVISQKGKTKKVKPNDSTINYLSNVVQLEASGNKNHFPVVAVSLQNGLTNSQTITFGNVPIAGVRNSSNNQLRLHPPITVRDAQVTDTRTTVGDSANIVLGSGLPASGFVITDSLKSIKSENTGSIRLDGSKLIPKGGISAGSSSAGSISLVGSPSSLGGATTVPTSAVPHQGQVYLTAVSGSNNTQLLQQLLNYRTIGKNTGVKLLGPSQSAVTGNRQTFVLQQEKEPS